ncbi:hypothetical protein GCM10023339_30550 [Alloalcanivorax gelatiniphagus]
MVVSRPHVLLLALTLTACTGTTPPADQAPSDAPTSPTAVPASATAPGTALEHGASAVLAWQPARDLAGELELAVEQVAEQRQSVFDGWIRDDAMTAARPYFVTVTLANVGDTDLGGQDVPLYLRDTDGALGALWTLGGDFTACQSGPLPVPFEAGTEAEMCLVYLVPDGGRIRDLVFQPTEGYDPITCTGEVQEPRKPARDAGRTAKGRG